MSFVDRNRKKNKVGGQFLAIPHAVLKSANFRELSAKAVKLLLDIGQHYNGNNNGDLEASWTTMSRLGWKSRDTLSAATKELQHFGFIVRTRQGGRNKCNLYALTWVPIHDCGGKLDAGVNPTKVASNEWKQSRPAFKKMQARNPPTRHPIPVSMLLN